MSQPLASFSLDSKARQLLLHAVPNELLHGFRVPTFDDAIGTTRDEYSRVIEALRISDSACLNRGEASLLLKSLETTLTELDSEFQTRTGTEISEAMRVKTELEAFIDKGVAN